MRTYRATFARLGFLSAMLLTLTFLTAPTAAASSPTEYDRVYATAHAQLGDKWQLRGRGPDRFDCSGLVWYSFFQNGLQDRIGYYRSVAGYYTWFKNQGLADKTNLRIGDLIVWGSNQHIGIYIGDGKAISTLTTRHGVSIHPVWGYLGIRVKAYLHTQITRP